MLSKEIKLKKGQKDLDVATCSLASPQTSPEKQAQCGFSASVTTLNLTQKINEQWLTLCRCSSTHRQPSQHCIKHTVGVLVFSSQLLGKYFHCVWCCMPLHFFIYEGYLILISDWVRSKQASFQSLLFLFISQCPLQQSDCATFWGMRRRPCPHPLSSLRWTLCNTRETSWSGKNLQGIKTYTQRHHKWHQSYTYWKFKII